MKDLTEKLAQFKQITMKLIKALQKGEINKLDDLLNNRQVIIDNMEKMNYTTAEFTDICNELDILNAQQELLELMKEKKDSKKEELCKIQLTRNANSNYNKSFYNNSGTFDKQI